MIAYVEGKLAEYTENSCIIITSGGVGYEVFIPAHTLAQLPARGENLYLYVATIVREDALELFGFSSWEERTTFQLLVTINRVGPRTGLAILSVLRPKDLRHLVARDDSLLLTQVPGIGKKTAQQIFLELKYKLKVDETDFTGESAVLAHPSVLHDAVAGLVNLGYEETNAIQVVKQILTTDPHCDVRAVLRKGLQLLAKGRS